MEVHFDHGENFTIRLIGRLDTVTSQEVAAQIEKQEITEPVVIVEAKDIEYISSAGLRLLLTLKKNLSSQNKSLEIHNLNDVNKEIFKVTGFINILDVK